MKKFLLLCLVSVCLATNYVYSQACTFVSPTVDINSISTDVNGNCLVNFNLSFTINANNGNKFTFIHLWTQTAYDAWLANPNYNNYAGLQASPLYSTAQATGNGAHLNTLSNALFTMIVDVQNSTLVTNYGPDATTPVKTLANNPGLTVQIVPAGNGNTNYFLNNISVIIPGACSSQIKFKGDAWSSNANNSSTNVQCSMQGFTIAASDPSIGGNVNCSNPRTVTAVFSTSDATYNSSKPFTGSFIAYADLPADTDNNPLTPAVTGTLGPEDPIVYNSGAVLSFYYGAPQPVTFNVSNTYGNVVGYFIVLNVNQLTNLIANELFNGCAPLPVSLKNFNATQKNGKATLSWETSQENENKGFEIQKRNAVGSFEKIGFVDSKAPQGTGGGYAYSFDDNSALANGITYYRLRQVDVNGTSVYSEIKAVRAGASNLLISVYPNPSRGNTNVVIPENAGKMDVTLNDYSGKAIQKWSGITVKNLQLTNLKPGIYMLRVNILQTGEQIVERIVVQ